MKALNALSSLEKKEWDLDQRLNSLAHQLSDGLLSNDYAQLFLVERAFLRNWQRREEVREVRRAVREVFE